MHEMASEAIKQPSKIFYLMMEDGFQLMAALNL